MLLDYIRHVVPLPAITSEHVPPLTPLRLDWTFCLAQADEQTRARIVGLVKFLAEKLISSKAELRGAVCGSRTACLVIFRDFDLFAWHLVLGIGDFVRLPVRIVDTRSFRANLCFALICAGTRRA